MKAPNDSYIELNFVAETATGYGNNQKVIMENLGNETFKLTEGQVGVKIGCHKPKSFIRPMAEWDTVFDSKIKRGYMVTGTAKKEIKTLVKNIIQIADEAVKSIVDRLMNAAQNEMEESFSVKIEDISDEMFQYGKDILDDLALNYESMSVSAFNNKLMTFYMAVPRRIPNLKKLLACRTADFPDIVNRERELFDILYSQLRENKIEQNVDFLEAHNLEWREATKDEMDWIKSRMAGQGKNLVNAWRIVNKTTEKAFNDYVKSESLTEEQGGINHCFHGSRTQNFWSIITNGLTINPIGVAITGKAFGNGTYFAIDAIKSLGYSDRYGSLWGNGRSNTGFMGMYKVATGKYWEPDGCTGAGFGWRDLQRIAPGSHCTWYHAGQTVGFRMDEIVVYQDCQSTIEYLLEVKAD